MPPLHNTHPRRPHRERAQPAPRQKYGLLEKRRDYRLRAADHRAKAAALRRLRAKAAARNGDEFAFGMVRGPAREKPGRTGRDRGVMALMRTQDVGYLRAVEGRVRAEEQRLRREVAGAEGACGARVVFGDDAGEGVRVERSAGEGPGRRLEVRRRALAALRERGGDVRRALRGAEEQAARVRGGTGGVNGRGVRFRARERRR